MSRVKGDKTRTAGRRAGFPTYQLIAIDMDGTLLDTQGQLSQGVEEAIQSAREGGVQIVLVSGRGMIGVLPWLARLQLEGPFIASGGAAIAEAPQGNLIDHRPVSIRWAVELARLGHAEHVVVLFEHPDWLISEGDGRELESETSAFGYRLTVVQDLAVDTPSAPSKIIMAGEPCRLAHIVEILREWKAPLNYVQTSPHYLDIYRKDVNKGAAVKRLARHLGVPVRWVVAIGDYYNDLDMFRVAGLAIAMGNAPLEVRQAAQLVAPSNDEGGAAWAITAILQGRGC
jgi:Cof subfamily protein (haloacid dehalogenase superfamily)